MRTTDDELNVVEVPLDDESLRRLNDLAVATRVPPIVLAASLLADVLRDDVSANVEAANEVASKLRGAAGKLH